MIPNNHHSERLRAAFAELAERAISSDQCPSPDRFWSALDGKLTRQDLRDLVDHTILCPACAESWRLARRLRNEAGLPNEAEPAATHMHQQLWWRWGLMAAAATVVLVASMTIVRFWPGHEPEVSDYREGSAATIRSLVPEASSLPKNRCLLRWTSGPADSSYSILIATEDLTVLARAHDLKATEYLVPESAFARLPAGAGIVWQVEANLPDGTRIGSGAFICYIK